MKAMLAGVCLGEAVWLLMPEGGFIEQVAVLVLLAAAIWLLSGSKR